MMKTKLRTFERKQILHKPSYKDNFLWKNDWNTGVHMTKT